VKAKKYTSLAFKDKPRLMVGKILSSLKGQKRFVFLGRAQQISEVNVEGESSRKKRILNHEHVFWYLL
jgi:hypothetical protein